MTSPYTPIIYRLRTPSLNVRLSALSRSPLISNRGASDIAQEVPISGIATRHPTPPHLTHPGKNHYGNSLSVTSSIVHPSPHRLINIHHRAPVRVRPYAKTQHIHPPNPSTIYTHEVHAISDPRDIRSRTNRLARKPPNRSSNNSTRRHIRS